MPRLLVLLLLLLIVGFTARPAGAHQPIDAGDLHCAHRAATSVPAPRATTPAAVVTASTIDGATIRPDACPTSGDHGTAPSDCCCPALCSALALPETPAAPVAFRTGPPTAAPAAVWHDTHHLPPVPPPRDLSA